MHRHPLIRPPLIRRRLEPRPRRPRLIAHYHGVGIRHRLRVLGPEPLVCLLQALMIPVAGVLRAVIALGKALPVRHAQRNFQVRRVDEGDHHVELLGLAGHGGQEPEWIRGNEADGLDETLIFHGFRPNVRPDNGERVIDDELGDRFARSGARGIRSIFLADSCHAGTLTRSIDGRADALGHRSAGVQTIQDDMLAGLDVASAEPAGQPNLLFIAGGQENQLVPEMMIDGKPHGATSFAFAQAVTRAVVAGQFPTSDAFARDVIAATRARAEGRHHPLAENRLEPQAPLIQLDGIARPTAAPAPPGALRLHVMPGGGALADAARGLPGVQIMPAAAGADAVLDPERAELVSGLGDLLAAALDPAALAGAMEKLAAVRLMQARGLPTMDAGLVQRGGNLTAGGANSQDQRHQPGAEFDLILRPPEAATLVIVSVAADGTVRVLSTSASATTPVREFRRGVRVTPQPGAAHVLAVALPGAAGEVQDALMTLDRSRTPLAAARALLSATGARAVSVFGFYVA